MTPMYQTAMHSMVTSKVPHAHELLDAINPGGVLRVVDIKLDRPQPPIMQLELTVTGLDPVEAERWATAHVSPPLIRLHAPLRRGRSGTLWFGRANFEQPPHAFVRLELPFAALRNANERDSFVTLTTCNDPSILGMWAKNERAHLAESAVHRILQPILSQVDQLGDEAVAVGLRTAMLGLEPQKAAGLLGCTVPVLLTGWIEAWAQTIALNAPSLRQAEAILIAERTHDDAIKWHPMVQRVRLTGACGHQLKVSPREDQTYWEIRPSEIQKLRATTGASLDTAERVVEFLEDVAALLLLQYRANGATSIQFAGSRH
jgi:hypothetical protein